MKDQLFAIAASLNTIVLDRPTTEPYRPRWRRKKEGTGTVRCSICKSRIRAGETHDVDLNSLQVAPTYRRRHRLCGLVRLSGIPMKYWMGIRVIFDGSGNGGDTPTEISDQGVVTDFKEAAFFGNGTWNVYFKPDGCADAPKFRLRYFAQSLWVRSPLEDEYPINL